jgi:hypothetical protein
MLVPQLKNIYVSGNSFQNVLYVVQLIRATLVSVNSISITFTRYVNIVSAGITVDSSDNVYIYASYQ